MKDFFLRWITLMGLTFGIEILSVPRHSGWATMGGMARLAVSLFCFEILVEDR